MRGARGDRVLAIHAHLVAEDGLLNEALVLAVVAVNRPADIAGSHADFAAVAADAFAAEHGVAVVAGFALHAV